MSQQPKSPIIFDARKASLATNENFRALELTRYSFFRTLCQSKLRFTNFVKARSFLIFYIYVYTKGIFMSKTKLECNSLN